MSFQIVSNLPPEGYFATVNGEYWEIYPTGLDAYLGPASLEWTSLGWYFVVRPKYL